MIQVYTGNGKGKTTAALGLALRAAGAGFRVFIGQFCKGRTYSELKSLRKIGNIKVEQFGRRCFIKKNPDATDKELARQGFERIKMIIKEGFYNIVILDEINIALRYKLLDLDEVLELIKNTPKQVELVFTGRFAPKRIIDVADLVSWIRDVKHYYKKGIKARRGIEF
ncbi:MAG: cob(I)yrinic acid a,c-diamide adenosyltransferase [Candidatus Omnitrophica bacterium]|nr:cob(I)yrinic acid a,c-diamide adenosyltransferase [Candidatus Omnitrophota bacterium]